MQWLLAFFGGIRYDEAAVRPRFCRNKLFVSAKAIPICLKKEATMLNSQNQELVSFLDYLAQPVLFVRGHLIVARNRAAAQLLQAEDSTIDALLDGEDLTAYDAYDGAAPMELTLCFSGRFHSATVHRDGDHDVFVAADKPLYEELSLDTLAVVAQAIRVPLTDLFDVASVLFPMLEEQEDPKIQRQTARLNKSFYRLLRLAGNLSDTGRFIAGERQLHLERTDLGEFFGILYDQAAPLCEAMGIDMEFRCPSKRFYGSIDRQKIERAVLNLVSNSLKFTPKGGRIVFRVEHTGTSVLVRIADNGEGMDPATMATLFDRYQHRNQPGDPRWGVGLGLPLVRHIANLHGGTVVVNSAPESGTTVTMSISLRQTASAPQLKSPALNYDYAGGYSHATVELADTMPSDVFDSMNIN